MDSAHELGLINQAIQKLLDENRNKDDNSGFFFPEEDDDRLLLSRLLSELESLKGEQANDQVELLNRQETISAYMIDGKVDNKSEDAGQVEKGNIEVITKTQEIDEELRKLESFKEVKGFDHLEVSSGQETINASVIENGADSESQNAIKAENENNEVIAKVQDIDEEPRKVEIFEREKPFEEAEGLSGQEAICCGGVIDGEGDNKSEDAVDKAEESNKQTQEIMDELRKLKRQNCVTHWLLSTTIVLIVAWQLSEVSLILKAKETLNHPFRTLGGMLAGMLKRPDRNGGKDAERGSSSKNQQDNNIIQTPSLKMPELPRVDLPGFNLHDSNNEA